MNHPISRRALVSAILAGVALHVPSKQKAHGEEVARAVPFSPDIAAEMAKSFILGSPRYSALQVGDPIPTYDSNGVLVGYAVGYYDGTQPHGHIVFDKDCPTSILQFSLEEGNLDPFSSIVERSLSSRRSAGNLPRKLIAFGPDYFGVPDFGAEVIETVYGEQPLGTFSAAKLRSSGTDEWEDVLISMDDAYGGGYTMSQMQYAGDLYPLSQSVAKRAAKLYACGPHALAVIACTLPNDRNTDTIIPYPFTDSVIASNYKKLWDYTKTYETGKENGITYGATVLTDLGPGFVRFCRENSTTVSTSCIQDGSFLNHVGWINNGRLSVVGGGILTPKGESGHFMPVNGYVYLHRKSDNKILQALSVFDGWNSFQFFNYDFPRYTWKGSIGIARG